MKPPFGMITVKEFSRERSQSIEMAIERLQNGTYKGKEIDGQWFVDRSELIDDGDNSSYFYSKNKVSQIKVKVTLIAFALVNSLVFYYVGTSENTSFALLGYLLGGLSIMGGVALLASLILFSFQVNSGEPKYKNETNGTIFLNIFTPTLTYVSIIIWAVMIYGKMGLNS